jgi:selenide,water dikinase
MQDEERLTSLVPAGGCARKLPAEDLAALLASLAPIPHAWVDAAVGPMDDAAIVNVPSAPPLVFTVDFITPVVDDAESFGAISAANALSDVYAMGGEPRVALAVCGVPPSGLRPDTMTRIFRGGRDKAAEAGCAIAGGHTIVDPELKYGLAVIGTLEGARSLAHPHARAGDRLVLTKPLGVGVASQALKLGRLPPHELALAVTSMTALNRGAKDAALAADAHAATDVTGFGLLGHLHHLLLGAKLAATVSASAVPLLPFARRLAREDACSGGSRRNLAAAASWTRFAPEVAEDLRLLLCDAQTSGGLLLAVPPASEARLLAELDRRGTLARAVIGELVAGSPGEIRVGA